MIKSSKVLKRYALSLGLVATASILGEFVQRHLEPTNLVMLYLLAVVIVAVFLGRGPAILASFTSVLAFDVLFVPPRFTITVQDVHYLVTFAVLLIVGLIISELASRIREKTILELKRERRIILMEEKEKLQTTLLNSISHDLRTPLVSITGSLSALNQDNAVLDDISRKELLKTAYEESVRLNELVGNLLDITRIEAGALKVHPKFCDLTDLIGTALHQITEKIGKREIKIAIPKDLPEVPADFVLMTRVFINLMDNALKYSLPNSLVEITAKETENHIRIEVKDRGIGIPEKDLNHIFEKFYRADRSHQITGTGLGLSICRGIVEAHKGKIWAENHPEGGSIFIIILPARISESKI